MSTTLSKRQIQFGLEKLTEFSKDLNVPRRKVVDILLIVRDLYMFYQWVNADEFIIMIENGEILLEDS